ncbi:replication factor A protein 3 [Hesseltinella vesiculosa]|uniref:Replication factor A protein 3 n=1 Tax=Hesseltinella vesiculosa TaxID=101127 RepID=A0A1X2G9Y4_9FUNG|nr:replication factor A protein 3 [Hesseltinella vesiculosa]
MDKPTERINSQLREKYVGHTIRISGKVNSFTGDTSIITASDGGQVLIKLNGQSKWASQFVEVIGRVEPDLSIMEFSSVNLGDSFGKTIFFF